MSSRKVLFPRVLAALAALIAVAAAEPAVARAQWNGFAGDAQHSAISDAPVPMQPLDRVLWSTPVDLDPQSYGKNYLADHYGSPLITAANSVIVPVKTGATGDFTVEALRAADGSQIWSAASDYVLPPHNWLPAFGPALTPGSRLYYPGAGGTLYYRDDPDGACGSADGCGGQVAFYGLKRYLRRRARYDATVMIDTPLTTDAAGDVYFGFTVIRAKKLGVPRAMHGRRLRGGIAMITPSGKGLWISARKASGDRSMNQVPQNCAPALSFDGTRVYVAVSNGFAGYLVALNASNLKPFKPRERVKLIDPYSGEPADLSNDVSSAPTVGPDGDVYYGVKENPCCTENDGRGWLLHYDSTLSTEKTPGAFGYDTTVGIVPAAMLPSYSGTSSYLLVTKYNDYADYGGSGENRIAVLDPDATESDPVNRTTVMAEVRTILGPTPNPSPPGVMEWCINSAAIDPSSDSILVNSEDGILYRWFPDTNEFGQSVVLTQGATQAYTPTVIGMDGTAYAISNATLFAVGQ